MTEESKEKVITPPENQIVFSANDLEQVKKALSQARQDIAKNPDKYPPFKEFQK